MFDNWQFYLNSILLGIGLAMDACAVSMANGLNEPKMKMSKTASIAALFAFFQALMPMIGWVCVHYVAEQFSVVNDVVPYVALALLGFIGGKMLYEGFGSNKKKKAATAADGAHALENAITQTNGNDVVCLQRPSNNAQNCSNSADLASQNETAKGQKATNASGVQKPITFWLLITQAVATSIDALSVGFTIADYNALEAFVAALIIAAITFGICFGAVFIGKKFGTKLGNKAEILGGFILIAIGFEIFIASFF